MQNAPIEFDQVIEALLNNTETFPARLLYNLSGIHAYEYQQMAKIWPQISLQRRRSLLEDLEMLASKDFLLDFDNVGRIALHDTDPVVIINAISLLWQAEDKKLIPQFTSYMLKHQDDGVRAAAASALSSYVYLGELDKLPEQTYHTLQEDLLKACRSDKSLHVRRRALEALGYSCREEVEALINKAFSSTDTLWLESALCAVGRSADNSWERKVLEFLDHPSNEVKSAAVHAAGELGLARARTRLIGMLDRIDEEDPEFKAELIWALSQIGGEGVQDTLEDLLDNTEDPDEIELLEEALDNLSFTEDSTDFDLFDVEYDEDDYDDDEEIDLEDEDEDY